MNIDAQDVFTGGGIIATIAGAIAAVKVGLYNKISYGKHAGICSGVQKEIYDKIDLNHATIINYLMEIKESIGELKGKGN